MSGKRTRVLEVIKHRITHLRADVVCAKYNHACNKVSLSVTLATMYWYKVDFIVHCMEYLSNGSCRVAYHDLSQNCIQISNFHIYSFWFLVNECQFGSL